MTDIVIKENKDIVYSGFRLHKNGLNPVGNPTFEQWESVGEFIKKSGQSVQFWLGDWLNYGEARWGEKYSQALDATDYSLGTLQNVSWVANSVPSSRRHENLSFSHHQNVAQLEPEDQDKWLKKAEEEGWTVFEMRQNISTKKPKKEKRKKYSVCPQCGFKYEI
jgi:hypothetical protein